MGCDRENENKVGNGFTNSTFMISLRDKIADTEKRRSFGILRLKFECHPSHHARERMGAEYTCRNVVFETINIFRGELIHATTRSHR
jgi:hypothetical protein